MTIVEQNNKRIQVIAATEFQAKRVVMIAVDGSQQAVAVVEWALQNIIKADDLVQLVNVRPDAFATSAPLFYSKDYYHALEAISKKNEETSTRVLLALGKLVKSKGLAVVAHSLCGDARHELVEHVAESKPDVVVVGRTGSGRGNLIKDLGIGRVSSYLIHHSSQPTLVVSTH